MGGDGVMDWWLWSDLLGFGTNRSDLIRMTNFYGWIQGDGAGLAFFAFYGVHWGSLGVKIQL